MSELYNAASRVIASWRLSEHTGWVNVRWEDLLSLMRATTEAELCVQCQQCNDPLVYVGVGYICGTCNQIYRIDQAAGQNVVIVAETQAEWQARKQGRGGRAK